jgi:D-hexose-6-phosphate mutarotase
MNAFFAAIITITNMCGVVSVDTHGARVTSYVPEGGNEVFFVSKTGTGGMPLCWPWFAGLGPREDSARHGIARYRDFKVVGTTRPSSGDTMLTLRLDSDEETRRLFPHDFSLTVTVRMNHCLTVTMTGKNTGSDPFKVTEAFHPYFAVGDSVKCRLEGEDAEVYTLDDPILGRTFAFADGSAGCGRRMWRPHAESHLSKTVSPIEADDWRKFVCVESGTMTPSAAYVLKPGESHTLVRTIRLSSTYNNAKPLDLQPQIEAAAAAGGGRVTVPPGEWLSKRAVHLRSNVELHLADGATLVFPDDPSAYLPAVRSSYSAIEFYGLSPLIYAYGATNVSITGGGTLTTRMGLWREWFLRDTATMFENQRRLYAWGENDTPVEERRFEDLRTARIRPCFVEFERCRDVRLEGFRLRYSPLWCVHLRLCDGVAVRGLDIKAMGHNNDGIDVNASRNVLIEGCSLDQGDDGFVIKSGRDRDGRRVGVPCENVEIRNCTVKRAHTLIGVGSEVSGGVRNISLHDCKVTDRLFAVVRVKTSDRKGAYIENVAVSNVEVSATANIDSLVDLAMNINYQWGKYPPREHIVTRIYGVRVENVRAEGTVRRLYSLHGDARLPPENIVLRNITAASCLKPSEAENLGKCELLQPPPPPFAPLAAEVLSAPVLAQDAKYSSWDAFYKKLFSLDADADEAWTSISSTAGFDARRAALRTKMIERMGGFPERTPLNAKVAGVVRRNAYRVEKVLFESRPGMFVTANLYLPDASRFNPPYPAAVELCGHADNGKHAPKYQRLAVMAAKNGLASFVVDPLGQGERRQSPEDDAGSPVENHLRMGVNAMLLGHNFAVFELWDAMRAMDYLDTRADIRHDGYGSMGNSGGGTQSVMLSAIDPRIKATATSCYLSNLHEQTRWRLLADCEQLIFGQLADGLNHAAYPLLGGNPVLMLGRGDDMIPFSGTLATARLLQCVARNLGRSGWYDFFSSPGPHGYNEQLMRQSVTYLVRQLRNETAVFDEPEFDTAKQDFGPAEQDLWVAPEGRVRSLDGFKSIYDSLNDELDAALAVRAGQADPARAKKVRMLADIDESRVGARTVVSESTLADGTKVMCTFYAVSDGYKMPVVEIVPPGAERHQPLVLAIDGARTNGVSIVRANANRAIFIPDLCACGEIGAARHYYHCRYDDEETAKMLYLLGASLVGRRAGELIALGNEAKRRFGKNPMVVTTGRLAVAAAHAIAAEPGLFTAHDFIAPPLSWTQAIRTRAQSLYSTSVHGALLQYDWTDL